MCKQATIAVVAARHSQLRTALIGFDQQHFCWFSASEILKIANERNETN